MRSFSAIVRVRSPKGGPLACRSQKTGPGDCAVARPCVEWFVRPRSPSNNLVFPLFVCPGKGVHREIAALPGQFHFSRRPACP